MLPTPATVRWSRSAALTGARLSARRSARSRARNRGSSGSRPTRASTCVSVSAGSSSSHVPKHRTPLGRLVAELVGRQDRAGGLVGGRLVSRVHVRERLALLDDVAALAQA